MINVNDLKVGDDISKKVDSNVYFNNLYLNGNNERIYHGYDHPNKLLLQNIRYLKVKYISSDYLLMQQGGWDGVDMVLNTSDIDECK